MNIQQMNYALAVAELRHFEQAAEQCFVTQSTLSTMIGKLEDEIGIKIFDRRTKPISITKDGEQVLEQLRIIVREIDGLENKVQELKGEIAGDLKIGVIPTVAPYLLPLFLSTFAQKYGGVNISVREMTTAEIQKALINRSLDVGIAAIPLEDPSLIEVELYDEPFLLFDCGSKPGKEKITFANIDYSRLLLLSEGHCMRAQVEQICNLSTKQNEHQLNFEFKAGSVDSLVRFTKAHKGVTLLPHLATLGLSEKDQAQLQNFAAPIPSRRIGLVVHQHFVKRTLLEAMRAMIVEEAGKLVPNNGDQQLLKPIVR